MCGLESAQDGKVILPKPYPKEETCKDWILRPAWYEDLMSIAEAKRAKIESRQNRHI
jgi:hypothetical protein